MSRADDNNYAELVSKLQIEMRILSDIARRVEYAIFEDLIPEVSDHSITDIQMLDLLIQSTESLETILGRLSERIASKAALHASELVAGLPLQDMATRIAGHQTNNSAPLQSYSKSTIDLF